MPHSLRALRHRRFAAVWTGALCSNIGTWMETVAVGVLVTETTGQAQWTGIVAAAAFVPLGLLGPLGGALADRVPRRTQLLTTTLIQTAFAATLTVLATVGETPPWLVTVIVFGSGCAAAVGLPAYQSVLPELVPRDDLPGAIALGSAQYNLGRVIGPAVAGVVLTVGDYSWAFAINTASFLAVVVAVAPLRLPRPRPSAEGSILASMRRGMRYVVEEPGTRATMAYMALFASLAAPFIALVPAVALKVFGDEKGGTAALVTAQGVGAVVMAVALGGLASRFGHRTVLVTVLRALPVALALYALAPDLPLAVAAMVVLGAVYLGCLAMSATIIQLRAPAALRGRAIAAAMLTLGILYPVGSVVQGAIADEVGLRATTTGAAVVLAGALVALRLLRPRFDVALADETVPGGSTPEDVERAGEPEILEW